MGNSLYQWRVTFGMFYCRCQRIRLLRKVSTHFLLQLCFIRLICRFLKVITDVAIREKRKFLNENFYVTMVQIHLTIAGDVEQNPGPEFFTYSLSVLHANIRSIRNNFEYLKDNFTDFDILSFTETLLDGNVRNYDIMVENYDISYRKDRTCHGGGLLVYINSNLAHERMDA